VAAWAATAWAHRRPSRAAPVACAHLSPPPGKDAADVEETTSIFSIAVIASCLLYVLGGFAYSWQTKKEIVHPHMQLWRVTLGLVKDGVAWTSAKAGGQEYKGVAPVYGEIPGAENYGAVSHIDIVPAAGGENDFMVQEMDSPVSTPRGSSAGGTPRKKKKKKKKGPKNEAGDGETEVVGLE
jgi:hypothetical protein